MALEDSGLPVVAAEAERPIGVSFGTALGGIANAESEHQSFLSKGLAV
jgi:3-oxoacyl-[acyl-carrier-protein] synthase II